MKSFSVCAVSYSFAILFLSLLCLSSSVDSVSLSSLLSGSSQELSLSELHDVEVQSSLLNFDTISTLLQSISNRERRDSVALDLLALLFEDEESLRKTFPQFVKVGLKSKSEMLSAFIASVMPSIVEEERKNSFKANHPSLDPNDVAMMASNANHCVSCTSIKNLVIIMCRQNYPLTPGTCVVCSFLRNITKLLCDVSCNTLSYPPYTTCLFCSTWYSSIQMLCGPPNCTSTVGPYYLTIEDPEDGYLSRSSPLQLESFAPLNCIPCYNIYTGYQLLCGDLFDYCPTTPVSPSATPLPSSTSTATASTTPTASATMTPTASVSMSATATPIPPPPPSASATPSASNYYWYYYYNDVVEEKLQEVGEL